VLRHAAWHLRNAPLRIEVSLCSRCTRNCTCCFKGLYTTTTSQWLVTFGLLTVSVGQGSHAVWADQTVKGLYMHRSLAWNAMYLIDGVRGCWFILGRCSLDGERAYSCLRLIDGLFLSLFLNRCRLYVLIFRSHCIRFFVLFWRGFGTFIWRLPFLPQGQLTLCFWSAQCGLFDLEDFSYSSNLLPENFILLLELSNLWCLSF
jgi:hypothetical protein